MVRSDPHMVSLKRSFLQAIVEEVEVFDASIEALLSAPLERVGRVVDEVLDRLEYGERALVELLFGLGDGYLYSQEDAAKVFQILPEHLPYERGRVLSRCRQVLEHIGV